MDFGGNPTAQCHAPLGGVSSAQPLALPRRRICRQPHKGPLLHKLPRVTGAPAQERRAPRSSLRWRASRATPAVQKPKHSTISAGSPVKAEARGLRGRGARLPPRASCLPPVTAFPRGTRRVGPPSLQAVTCVGRTYGDACVRRDCSPAGNPGCL